MQLALPDIKGRPVSTNGLHSVRGLLGTTSTPRMLQQSRQLLITEAPMPPYGTSVQISFRCAPRLTGCSGQGN